MTVLTLLTKINNGFQLKQIEKALKLPFEGLDVQTKVLGATVNGWIQISLTGLDAGIARSFIVREIGLCPIDFKNVRKFSNLNGYIKSIRKNEEELLIDVGILNPEVIHATVALDHLQAQLMDGKKIGLRKVTQLFGLCTGFLINVKVIRLNREESRIDAELSSMQIRKFAIWQESMLDRLLLKGLSFQEVTAKINQANLNRDVIDVEPIGLLEHALTCKLGTDAAGLIPKIGRAAKNARFAVFNPKAIRNFLNN
jgi:hypothetical protein